MAVTKKNQTRPIRLSLEQALRIVWLVEDLAGQRKLTAFEDAVLMPMAEQIQLIHAQMQAELDRDDRSQPARDIPIRAKPVDNSP